MGFGTVNSQLRRARTLSWALVIVFAGLAFLRWCQGHALRDRMAWGDLWWDLKVFWLARGFLVWSVFFLILAAWGTAVFLFLKLTRTTRPVTSPEHDECFGRHEAPRALSPGAVGLVLVGLLFAASGAVLCYLPWHARNAWPAVILTAGLVAVGISGPELLLSLRRRVGKSLVLPACLLGGLGATLWLSREDALPKTSWIGGPDFTTLCDAGSSSYRLGRRGMNPPTAQKKAAYETALVIEREILREGEWGVRGVLDYRDYDCWWTKRLLKRFGRTAVPLLLDALDHPYQPSRVRAVSVLALHADDAVIARQVVSAFRDPSSLVRSRAAEFFTSGEEEKGERPPAARLEASIGPLKELLWDRNAGVRRNAILALRHQDPDRGWPELQDFLRIESDKSNRDEALLNLAGLKDRDAFRTLVTNLDDRNRTQIAAQLPRLDGKAVGALLDLLGTSSDDQAQGFLRSDLFEKLRLPQEDVRHLSELASGDDIELRRTALSILSQLEDPEAVEVARAALETPEAVWVLQRLRRRGKVGDAQLLKLCQDRAKELIGYYAPSPADKVLLPSLTTKALDRSRSAGERSLALGWTSAIDPAGARRIAESILEEGRGNFPIYSLIRHLSLPAIRAALRSGDESERMMALYALKEKKVPEVISELIELIEKDPSDGVRKRCVLLMGEWKVASAVPALSHVVVHGPILDRPRLPRDSLLLGALEALGEIGDPAARGVLQEALERATEAQDVPTMRAAAVALAGLGDAGVVPILREAMRWPHYGRGCSCRSRVSCRAALAASRLGEPGVEMLLAMVDEPEVTDFVSEMLGRSGSDRAREPLLELLGDPRPKVRKGAALGLGHLKDPRTLQALVRTENDPVPEVAQAVRWAVQEVSGRGLGMQLLDGSRHGAQTEEAARKVRTRWIHMGPKEQEAWKARHSRD